MNKIVHKVALVLDPHFGEKLFPIAERMHVWAVNSPKNSAAAKEWWHKNNDIFFKKEYLLLNTIQTKHQKKLLQELLNQ